MITPTRQLIGKIMKKFDETEAVPKFKGLCIIVSGSAENIAIVSESVAEDV